MSVHTMRIHTLCHVLNLCLMMKSIILIIPNYETDHSSIGLMSCMFFLESPLKEYAQAEGVLAKLGVASESVIDLSCENGVSEMVEYCEKVPRISARPHVDLVLGGNGTDMHLTRADT
jgi:hypothetical protein